MQKTGDKKRFYARRGLVMRPVFMLPAEAEAIRQAAFHAHISQQQWMREVLAGLRTVGPVRTGAYTSFYEPAPPEIQTNKA